MSTKSGTNQFHGGVYGHRGTNWINAAPFFFKKDDNIPAADKNPQLHRYSLGGDAGRTDHQEQALRICRAISTCISPTRRPATSCWMSRRD